MASTRRTSSTVDLQNVAVAPFVAQDLDSVKGALDGINLSAQTVSQSLSNAFAGATVNSRQFASTLQGVTAALAQVLSQSLAGPLQSGFSSILGGFAGFGGNTGGESFVAPFANGGIVASPTFFGAGGSVGLMGERGAEAIVPLARGPNGQLGIASQGGATRPVNVNVSINATDAESFRRSETQVASALARAVARGQRGS